MVAAMRSIWITKHGGPNVLECRDTESPVPKAREVKIRVRAAGLNFADVMARQGLYPDAPPPPMVVGYEAAGEIVELGEGVGTHAVGTRVIALCRFGGQAEEVCVPAGQALPMPDAMTFEEGAALPVVYLTAYHMLFRVAHLRPKMRVLVHMAAGGVGLAALQLCRTVANVEIFGTASPSKHEFLKQQGCDHTIDYRTVDYAEEVKKLTDGKGVDIILDALGGKDWKKGMGLLRPVGHLVAFGFANMASGEKRSLFRMVGQALQIPLFSPMGLMDANRSVSGVNIGHLWGEIDMLSEELAEIIELYEKGSIKPIIDAVIPFADAKDAHARLSTRQNVGKVVLVP